VYILFIEQPDLSCHAAVQHCPAFGSEENHLRTTACIALAVCILCFSGEIAAKQVTSQSNTSGTPEARIQFDNCRLAIEQGNFRAAVDCLHRVVETDPNFARAWLALGVAQVSIHDLTEGIQDIRKAISLEPNQVDYYRRLAMALMLAKREGEALDAWKQLRNLAPDDPDATKNIVTILVDLDRYAEALPELEWLVKQPGGQVFLLQLGVAYAHVGQKENAISAFQQALQFDSSNDSLNAVAYVLTLENLRLDLAEQYAEQGVRQRERATASISLENLKYDNLREMPGLGGDWDTLGWVYFRLGKYDRAEKYLKSAWSLFESATIGDHLAQVYEKLGKKSEAIQTYAQAIVAGDAPGNSYERLVALCGNKAMADENVEEARVSSMRSRIVKVDYLAARQLRAEFFMLIRPGPRVVEVRQIKGAESLANARSAIAGANFEVPFPDDGPTQIVRRGILRCDSVATGCEFELIPPDHVQSVE
jgi:tetratricopeptide (TPR) repeat protein